MQRIVYDFYIINNNDRYMSTHDLQSSPAYLPYPETLAKSHHAPRVLGEIKNINGAIETMMQKKKE